MNRPTAEWVEKAEADFASLQRELRSRTRPNHDLACFLAQQCVEKYVKARLVRARIAFSKTHDLSVLLHQAVAVEPAWTLFGPVLSILSKFAVKFRYPGASADRKTAREMANHCKAFRTAARMSLGLP